MLLVISGQYYLYGQNSHIDSLEKVLQQALVDSARVRTLVSLSKSYQFIDFAKGLSYAEEAVKLSQKIDQPRTKTLSHQNLAYYYTLSGDYSTALNYSNLSLQNSLLTKDSILLAATYNFLGRNYYNIGEYDEAYFYFTRSYGLAKKNNDSAKMALALYNVGCVFKEMGQYDRAMSHITLSRNISHSIKDGSADAYYYHEIGDIQIRKGQYDSALTSLFKSKDLANTWQLEVLKPSIFTKIAHAYLLKNDFERSFSYYDSTYALYRKTNNRYGMAEVYLGRGVVYLNQQKYDQAENLIEHSLDVAHAINARVLEIQCHKNLYAIAEQQGEYKNALNYFKLYTQLEDSLFSQEMLQRLYRDQIRFETESRDLQIAALNQKDAKQKDALKREEFIRNILVVIFALSVILLVTVYRSGQRRKQINNLLLVHHEEMERRSEELERLNQVKDKFFSIISHDLRSPINALSGILDIMAKGGLKQEDFAEHTRELRMRFNHTRTLLNNLLDWTLLQMDKLSLQPARIDLRKIVEENVQIVSSLQTKQITITNNIPEEAFGFADSNTINLVVRNLLTNAIKFTNDGGEVTLSAGHEDGEWILSVHDNGVGIRHEVQQILFDKTSPYTTRGTANEKGTGLGLILCKEFVEKNGGRIWVESEEGKGSSFLFTVPKFQG